MNATATGALAKDEPWSAERVHAFCAAIMRTTERLARTAAELGDMSRLTDAAGSDSVQAVELDGAIRTCIANPSVGVARTPVDVSRALPPVLADRPETGPGEGGPTGRIAALTTNATDMSIVVKDIDERRRKGLADLARERTKSGGAPTMGPQGGQPRSLGGAACFHDRFGTGPWRCSSSRSFRCWPSPCRFGASPQAGSETPGLRAAPLNKAARPNPTASRPRTVRIARSASGRTPAAASAARPSRPAGWSAVAGGPRRRSPPASPRSTRAG